MLLIIGIVGYAFITKQWLMGIIAGAFVFMAMRYSTPREEAMVPKLLVSNDTKSIAPFIDATGSHAGALLGDVRHDPFQSGGLETPSHDRVEAGAIHRAQTGVSSSSTRSIPSDPPFPAEPPHRTPGRGVPDHRPERAFERGHGPHRDRFPAGSS